MTLQGEIAVGRRPDPRTRGGPADDERRLVSSALAGDLSAFDLLVEQHWRKVASVAGQFLADPNDAEDAVQETFVRAFENLRSFRGEASVRTWLIRIAVNVCKTRRSEFWRRRVSLTDDEAALQGDPADARALAEAAMLRGDRERAVGQALHQLPDRLRLPLVLHFFEELSGAETAAVLGWNESTVWSRIYAGLRELRKRLASD